MSCEIIANGRRYGCGDDDACTSDKQVGVPEKRVVRKDVPFMNGTYDFSKMTGEVYFGDRPLEYVFGVVGSPTEVLDQVFDLTTWLYGIHDADIWDSDIPFWHFHGSCDKVKVKYDETGMSADVSASFTVYPFLIADSYSEFELSEGENYVLNKSRKARIFLMANDGDEPTITVGDVSQTGEGGEWLDLELEAGQNVVEMRGCSSCLILWREERL